MDEVEEPYLSAISAFFSSASVSKMWSSLRSGNCVMKWTKDVTKTRLERALSKCFFFEDRARDE